MQCIIITTENKQQFDQVQSITLPAFGGELQILPEHAESFIALRRGTVVLENKKTNAVVPLEGGICYFKDNFATIITSKVSYSSLV